VTQLSVDVTFLEGVDVEGSPPCAVLVTFAPPVKCGRPSVARVRGECPVCCRVTRNFVCERCLKMAVSGTLECGSCHLNGVVTNVPGISAC
jgi:hypothetical protein